MNLLFLEVPVAYLLLSEGEPSATTVFEYTTLLVAVGVDCRKPCLSKTSFTSKFRPGWRYLAGYIGSMSDTSWISSFESLDYTFWIFKLGGRLPLPWLLRPRCKFVPMMESFLLDEPFKSLFSGSFCSVKVGVPCCSSPTRLDIFSNFIPRFSSSLYIDAGAPWLVVLILLFYVDMVNRSRLACTSSVRIQ